MRRRHLSRRGSSRNFFYTANKVHRRNLSRRVMRGGIRF